MIPLVGRRAVETGDKKDRGVGDGPIKVTIQQVKGAYKIFYHQFSSLKVISQSCVQLSIQLKYACMKIHVLFLLTVEVGFEACRVEKSSIGNGS
jgi:hypothetical protein